MRLTWAPMSARELLASRRSNRKKATIMTERPFTREQMKAKKFTGNNCKTAKQQKKKPNKKRGLRLGEHRCHHSNSRSKLSLIAQGRCSLLYTEYLNVLLSLKRPVVKIKAAEMEKSTCLMTKQLPPSSLCQ